MSIFFWPKFGLLLAATFIVGFVGLSPSPADPLSFGVGVGEGGVMGISVLRFASALEQEEGGGRRGGRDGEESRGVGNRGGTAAKWNGDIIEWVSFKAAKALGERQLEAELEASRKSLTGGGKMGAGRDKVKGKQQLKKKGKSKGKTRASTDMGTGLLASRPKPFLFLFHKSNCPACKVLERSFSNSMAIEVLSEYFTMVSVGDDEDPADPAYEPQGAYFPRILFAAANGTVLSDAVRNDTPVEEGHDHYFADADSVVVAMKKTLRLVGGFTTFRGL